jgi:hypothetical protein
MRFEALAHAEHKLLTVARALRAPTWLLACALVLAVLLVPTAGTARAGTPYVDGISDQSLPVWNGSFSASPFASFFRASWVGQIALARYVVQWNAMAEASSGPNAGGDYRERFEAWLQDVQRLGLAPVVAVTSYTRVYPNTAGEYQQEIEALMFAAERAGLAVGFLEAWNEPNNQGNEPAAGAGEIANWAQALCAQRGCQVIAGDFEDAPSLAGYEQTYIDALSFSPSIWGIHPYRSVKAHSDAPVLGFEQALPDRGAGAQIWFTEIGAYYCAHGQVLGEAPQASNASYLITGLIPAIVPTHVFYYGFMAGANTEVPCTTGGADDSELYRASGEPRAAAGVLFAGPERPLALASSLGDGLTPFD